MSKKRLIAIVAAAMVLGVVVGNVASGFAASAPATRTAGSTAPRLGLRLGSAMRDSGGRLLDIVAKLTGKTTAQVVTERQAGKTFTQIGAENGVTSAQIVDEALKARIAVLDAKVKDGTITAAQADAAKLAMKSRLTQRVDTANTACTGAGAGAGGCGMGRGAGQGAGSGCGAGRGAGSGCGGNCSVVGQ